MGSCVSGFISPAGARAGAPFPSRWVAVRAGEGEAEGAPAPKKRGRPAQKKADGAGEVKKKASEPEPGAAAKGGGGTTAAKAAKAKSPAPAAKQPIFDQDMIAPVPKADGIYEGDKSFNRLGNTEDVVASWSVGGKEFDVPDWRPQAKEKYFIEDPSVSRNAREAMAALVGLVLRALVRVCWLSHA
jgi:hypothetical protein